MIDIIFLLIQAPDEDCLGKLQRIIERVQYLPNLEHSSLSDVSEDFIIISYPRLLDCSTHASEKVHIFSIVFNSLISWVFFSFLKYPKP